MPGAGVKTGGGTTIVGGGSATPGGGSATPGGGSATPGGGKATLGGGKATLGGGKAGPGGGSATRGGGNATPREACADAETAAAHKQLTPTRRTNDRLENLRFITFLRGFTEQPLTKPKQRWPKIKVGFSSSSSYVARGRVFPSVFDHAADFPLPKPGAEPCPRTRLAGSTKDPAGSRIRGYRIAAGQNVFR